MSLPPTALLARVKDFLPQIAAANKALDEKIKKDGLQSVDIEHVGEDEEQVIQMNINLLDGEEPKDSVEKSTDGEKLDDSTESPMLVVPGSATVAQNDGQDNSKSKKRPLISEI